MLPATRRRTWLARISRWHEAVSLDHARWYLRFEQAKTYTADPFEQADKIGDVMELQRRMDAAGARWPLAPEEWRLYGLTAYEIPSERTLQQVVDAQVRSALTALNRAAEQRDRVKAAALFRHILGSSPDNFKTSVLFSIWKAIWRAANGFVYSREFDEEQEKRAERLLSTPPDQLFIPDNFAFAKVLRQP